MKGEEGCCQSEINNGSHGTCGCMEKENKRKVIKLKGKEDTKKEF